MQNWTWRYRLGEFWAHSPSSLGNLGTSGLGVVPKKKPLYQKATTSMTSSTERSSPFTTLPCGTLCRFNKEALPGLTCPRCSESARTTLYPAFQPTLSVPSTGCWSSTMQLPSCTTWMALSCLIHQDCAPARTHMSSMFRVCQELGMLVATEPVWRASHQPKLSWYWTALLQQLRLSLAKLQEIT